MAESWVVTYGDWFEAGRVVHRYTDYAEDNFFRGLSNIKWGYQVHSDLYEQRSYLKRSPKFDDAPIGYKVKPISVSGKTFYV